MELLQKLYRIQAPSGREEAMTEFIQNILDTIPNVKYNIDKMGNIYVVKGNAETYPCVIAHTDEVHHRSKTGYEVISIKDEIILGYDNQFHYFSGIGADDKNGIWVALKCLLRFDAIKCAFFVQEERGCIGSEKADIEFFKDCRYVIQCDRKGNSDLIDNIGGMNLCSKKFLKDIEYKRFGYKRSTGFLSDVAALKQKGLDVSCVNISCGYFEPHTAREYTVVSDLRKCLDFVFHIIETCTAVYPHKKVTGSNNRIKGAYSDFYNSHPTNINTVF